MVEVVGVQNDVVMVVFWVGDYEIVEIEFFDNVMCVLCCECNLWLFVEIV